MVIISFLSLIPSDVGLHYLSLVIANSLPLAAKNQKIELFFNNMRLDLMKTKDRKA